MYTPEDPDFHLPDGHIGVKAVDLGLITPRQLQEVLTQLSQGSSLEAKDPPSLASALVKFGLLSQRQIDTLRDDTAARLKRLGKYRILRELGRGAMGAVYEAVDSELGRTVALKLLLRSPQANPKEAAVEEERFIREARLSASLPKHPQIVGVHEAGILEGHHYIAMEFIEGNLFSTWRRKNPNLRTQIAVLRDTALAVDHAHRHGIIHRDLKPANILVDAEGQPHVTDFGLAKQARQDASLTLTGAGRVAGTPIYMSPEQAEGRRDVDRRTDLWALGIMLYEILAGRPPFRGETPIDVMMKIVKDPVPPPSTVIREGANVAFDRVLEQICLKALVKNPKHRYASARAFAEDLSRWLKGQTVEITTVREPARKPMIVGAVALGAIVLVAAGIYLIPTGPSAEEMAAAKMARVKELVLQGQRLLDLGNFSDAHVSFGEACKLDPGNRAAVAGKLEAEKRMAGRSPPPPPPPAIANQPRAGSDSSSSPSHPPVPAVPEAIRRAREFARGDPKNWEGLAQIWNEARGAVAGTPFLEEATREYEAAKEKWRRSRSEELAEIDKVTSGYCKDEAFGSARGVLGGAAKRHDDAEWGLGIRARQDDLEKMVRASFQPLKERALEAKRKDDASTLAALRARVDRWMWPECLAELEEVLAKADVPRPPADPPSPMALAELPSFQGHENGICSAAFSPDEKLLVTTSFDKTTRLWDVAARAPRTKLVESDFVPSVAFSPDGRWISAGMFDGSLKIWDPKTLEVRTIPAHSVQIKAIAFSPDSKSLASASVDGTVKVWDPVSGSPRTKFEGHPRGAMSLAFSPDGKWLAVGCADSLVKVWDTVSLREHRQVSEGIQGATPSVAISPNGKLLATGGQDGGLTLWELETGRRRPLAGHSKVVQGIAFSHDGHWVASASTDGTLKVWDVGSGELRQTLRDRSGFYSVTFSPKGNFLAGCSGSWSVRVWPTSGLRLSPPNSK